VFHFYVIQTDMEGSPTNESEEQSYIKVHEVVFKLKAIHDRVSKKP